MANTESTYNRSLFLKTWAIIFGAVGLPTALFTGFSLSLLYAALGSFLLALPIYFLVTWIGEFCGNVYSGLGHKTNIREQLAGELDKARQYVRQQEYDVAQLVIEDVLENDPENADALMVKAQIEIQTGNTKLAKATLRQVRQLSRQGDPNRRWAATLLEELMDEEQSTSIHERKRG